MTLPNSSSTSAVPYRSTLLLTFAMLVSLGGCEPHAKGHIAGNLRVGNNRTTLLAVLTTCCRSTATPAR